MFGNASSSQPLFRPKSVECLESNKNNISASSTHFQLGGLVDNLFSGKTILFLSSKTKPRLRQEEWPRVHLIQGFSKRGKMT